MKAAVVRAAAAGMGRMEAEKKCTMHDHVGALIVWLMTVIENKPSVVSV